MTKVEYSGIIQYGFFNDSFERIFLIQSDGYKIDLISRVNESIGNYGSNVQVNYYISDSPCTKNEIVEGWLKKISGHADASYEASAYSYSSWTSGTDYDTNLKIGKHDLYSELRGCKGKFIIIVINFKA